MARVEKDKDQVLVTGTSLKGKAEQWFCHSQTTVSYRSHSRALGRCSNGCLLCTQTSSEGSREASEIDRSLGEVSKHLIQLEDDRGWAKRLEKVLRSRESHSHSEERQSESEFNRRTSLELVLWFYTSYIHKGHET
jgi:hypothetical protein